MIKPDTVNFGHALVSTMDSNCQGKTENNLQQSQCAQKFEMPSFQWRSDTFWVKSLFVLTFHWLLAAVSIQNASLAEVPYTDLEMLNIPSGRLEQIFMYVTSHVTYMSHLI